MYILKKIVILIFIVKFVRKILSEQVIVFMIHQCNIYLMKIIQYSVMMKMNFLDEDDTASDNEE